MITEQQINAAHAEATAQRGPRKGRLKATCPPMGTLAAAYWQGVMFEVNPLKVSIARMIFMSEDEREMFELAQAGAKAMMKKRA